MRGNKLNDSEMIAVIQGRKDGKEIEREHKKHPNLWAHMGTYFNFFDFNYRVKPKKPTLYWLAHASRRVDTKGEAYLEYVASPRTDFGPIKVIELTDEVRSLLGDLVDD